MEPIRPRARQRGRRAARPPVGTALSARSCPCPAVRSHREAAGGIPRAASEIARHRTGRRRRSDQGSWSPWRNSATASITSSVRSSREGCARLLDDAAARRGSRGELLVLGREQEASSAITSVGASISPRRFITVQSFVSRGRRSGAPRAGWFDVPRSPAAGRPGSSCAGRRRPSRISVGRNSHDAVCPLKNRRANRTFLGLNPRRARSRARSPSATNRHRPRPSGRGARHCPGSGARTRGPPGRRTSGRAPTRSRTPAAREGRRRRPSGSPTSSNRRTGYPPSVRCSGGRRRPP